MPKPNYRAAIRTVDVQWIQDGLKEGEFGMLYRAITLGFAPNWQESNPVIFNNARAYLETCKQDAIFAQSIPRETWYADYASYLYTRLED